MSRSRCPPSASRITQTLRANLAYILINRDGPGHPARLPLLRALVDPRRLADFDRAAALGHADEVRDFIDWYAPFQFANGKVPCCVDSRGADPVPENDSHGEFIYLVAEYYRHTRDRALARADVAARAARAVDVHGFAAPRSG